VKRARQALVRSLARVGSLPAAHSSSTSPASRPSSASTRRGAGWPGLGALRHAASIDEKALGVNVLRAPGACTPAARPLLCRMIREEPRHAEPIHLSDFPKIYCPFIRQTFAVDKEQWKERGRPLEPARAQGLPGGRARQPRATSGCFEDPETIAVEKLNGMNVKAAPRPGAAWWRVQNRLNVIDPLQVLKGQPQSWRSVPGHRPGPGQGGRRAGRRDGRAKVQANPYRLQVQRVFPFTQAIDGLRYRSFHEHERTSPTGSAWFKEHLTSRFFPEARPQARARGQAVMAEGVVFYNLKRQAAGQTYMAKLRATCSDWYYQDQWRSRTTTRAAGTGSRTRSCSTRRRAAG